MRPKEYFNAAVMAVALSTVTPHFADGQQQRTQLAQTEPHHPYPMDVEDAQKARIIRITDSLNAFWGQVFKSCDVDAIRPGVRKYYDKNQKNPNHALYYYKKHSDPILRGNILIFKNRFYDLNENEAHAVLGHEMGHYVQDLQNRLPKLTDVEREQEADMLLGVYANGLKKEGRLPGGFMEGVSSWLRKSKPEPATHGTTEQREAKIRYGYEHGLPDNFCSKDWGLPKKVEPPKVPNLPGKKARRDGPQGTWVCEGFRTKAEQIQGPVGQRQLWCMYDKCMANGGEIPSHDYTQCK
jgi:predicted metalloprotease